MIKITGSSNKPAFSKNNDSRSVSNRNNNSRPASEKNNSNIEVNGFGVCRNGVEYAKKLRKLSKLGKLKSEKTSKFWNLAKLGKK